MDDRTLLQQYLRNRSEQAFAEVVKRHADWVYSVAVRRLRDGHLAEDVTQAVFLALAQQAELLRLDEPLSPWLFQVTRYASTTMLRTEARRRHHEQEAAAMASESTTMTEGEWERLVPVLDDLVARLGKADRQAVLLRFYERKSFAEVGTALGTSAEAARKRVDRAVMRLRKLFAGERAALSSATLMAGLSAYTTQSAPAGVVATAAALPATPDMASASAITAAKGAMNMMMWAKAKAVAIIAGATVLLGALGTGILLAQLAPRDKTATRDHGPPAATAPASATTTQPTSNPVVELGPWRDRILVYLPWQHQDVSVPAPVLLPEAMKLTPEYQEWQRRKNVTTLSYSGPDQRRYVADALGWVGLRDGRLSPLIPKIRVYRPDGTLEAETTYGADGIFLGTDGYGADGTTVLVHTSYGFSPDRPERWLSEVYVYDKDGGHREWHVNMSGTVYTEFAQDSAGRDTRVPDHRFQKAWVDLAGPGHRPTTFPVDGN